MPFLLYGAYGYTGRLIADLAVARGLRLTLAGRDAGKLAAVAGPLGLDAVPLALDDPAALDAALADVPLVLHAAGPFSATSVPMVEACLRTGTHYLDVTGEIAVFEALAARDAEAKAAGITVLPGTGFDVVPTDCLAAHLHARLPSATALKLAIRFSSSASHGTAQTMVEGLGLGGTMRRGGRIVGVPPAHDSVEATFSGGKTATCVAIPWGDVSTAFHSTGIPTITTYAAMPAAAARVMKASRYLGPVLQSGPVQALLRGIVSRTVTGPDAEARERGRSLVWGEVTDGAGGRAVATWAGPEGYAFTADAALRSALAVLEGRAAAGFQTPSTASGADFALEMEGTSREDVA